MFNNHRFNSNNKCKISSNISQYSNNNNNFKNKIQILWFNKIRFKVM